MKYGLIGEKLGHSFSKEIHESITDYQYDLCPLTKNEFPTFMDEKAFSAINVTIPYKKDVIPYLSEMDDNAKAIGAVNTIVNNNGCLIGHNTDFSGFLYMVKKHNITLTNKKVLIIGNGGASAAIQGVVKHEHAKEMLIVDIISTNGAISYEECLAHHCDAQIIINTSPIGMYPSIEKSPIDLLHFPLCESIIDVIYNPMTTTLCYQAKNLNIQYVNGLEMLIAQAKYAAEFFLNKKIDDNTINSVYQKMLYDRCNIVLIGMPSAGKTSIANKIASTLHKQVIDMDEEIVKKAKKSIPEIFAEVHETGFRKIESEVAYEVAKSNNAIIATGGGCIKTKENMEYLSLNGIIIFIDRHIDNLISSDPNRPLSKNKEAIQQMYQERIESYKKYADVIIDNNKDIASSCQAIIDAYKTNLTKR